MASDVHCYLFRDQQIVDRFGMSDRGRQIIFLNRSIATCGPIRRNLAQPSWERPISQYLVIRSGTFSRSCLLRFAIARGGIAFALFTL